MKPFVYLLAGIALAAGIAISYNIQAEKAPKVFAGVIVEEYDGMVPLFLNTIETWDYPKNNIHMEMHLVTGSDSVKKQLEDWAGNNRSSYGYFDLVDDRAMVSNEASRTDINKFLASVKDGMMAASKNNHCEYCFITSSDTLLRPYTLSHLIQKKKPVIAPMLYAIPKKGDPFRNFFAAITENGYYKDDPQYATIANRKTTGIFALPLVHKAYLIDTNVVDKLSFKKEFIDWEFLSFSESARNNDIQQYLTNEREFGVFLKIDDNVPLQERKKYSPIETSSLLSHEQILKAIEPFAKEYPSLLVAAEKIATDQIFVVKLPDGSRLAVDGVSDAIDKHYLKQNQGSENFIGSQFKKYVRPGTEAVIVGDRDEADLIALSHLVGDNGKVQVIEHSDQLFVKQAINNQLNGIRNIFMKKPGSNTPRIDDMPLDNTSFIFLGNMTSAPEALKGSLQTIQTSKPVVMAALPNDKDLKGVIEEIRSLGYLYTSIVDDFYLFIPLEMAGLDYEDAKTTYKLPPLAELLDGVSYDQSASHPTVKVTWDGTFLDFTSLSHVNRALTEAVLKYPSIELTSITPPHYKNDFFKFDELKQMASRIKNAPPADTEITVRHKWPPKWEKPKQGKWVLIQPWEFGILPEKWVWELKNVDEVWVPTNYVKQIYVDSGIAPEKVFIVPNGINPNTFHEGMEPYPLPTKKKFKFLFLGGTIHRKGADILLKSYLQAFDSTDDVCLVFKDFGSKDTYANMTICDKIINAQKSPGAPEIVYLDGDMDIEDIARIYAACDCLVYPYRGEGFAMPVLEAMACGLPVMVSAGGATDDFVNNSFGWMIPSKRVFFGDMINSGKLAGNGWVLDPDAEILSGMMRWVSEHPELAKAKGKNAAKFAREYMTWDRMAPLVVERLEALKGQ